MFNKSLTIINDIQQIEYLHQQVEMLEEEWALPVKLVMQLNLVMEEIISNIILYGYQDKDEHLINISLEKNDHEIKLEIRDDAVAFNPLKADSPNLDLPAEEREIGGLGIYFIQQLMDKVMYERIDKFNVLTLIKYV